MKKLALLVGASFLLSTTSLAADLPFGILMTLLYLWRRDLAANAIAHAAALVVGLLSLPRAAA